MGLLNLIAPRLSRRRIALKALRDFVHRPASLAGHLSGVNFHNARIAAGLRINCNVCGTDGGVQYDWPDVSLRRAHAIGVLRETLACRACGASMRDRQIAAGLLSLFAERFGRTAANLRAWREAPAGVLRILDTDSFSAINRALRGLPGYAHSQFKPSLGNGKTLPDGSVNVNLLEIPFPPESFDVILTSDVMEHVDDDVRAHREIHRCLAHGGTYVFTLPFDPCLQGHRVLSVPASDSERFILEHHVHGDPHSAGGIIAHRIYGQQIFGDFESFGFRLRFETLRRPAEGIFDGDLFLARKD